MEEANVVTNCEVYNSSQVCLSCSQDYYIKDGKCTAVTTLISNCEFYASDTLCSDCDDGYYLADDAKSCKAFPGTANCLYFSKYKCEKCKSSHIFN